MRGYLEKFGIWGPVVLAMIQALQVVLMLPGLFGFIAGSAMFGAFNGFVVNYIGVSAGSLMSYWLARQFGTSLVKKMVSTEKYEKWVIKVNQSKNYMVLLFLAILLPLAPDDVLCYLSGLTSMSAKRFTWIIVLGKPWCILFYSYFFEYIM